MPAAAKKEKTLAEALYAVQGEITKVQKDGKNPHFGSTYATLPGIMEELLPVLRKNDLLLSQVMDCTPITEKAGLRTVLFHVPSGQSIEGTAVFPEGLNAQQTGSAVTYFRRYGVLSILGIVADTDDDGNVASKPAPAAVAAQATQADVLPAAPAPAELGGLVL